MPALHRAAAAWCEEHGLADDAVRHALAAGDAAWAARLIERHVDALFCRSEGATLQRWLSALPAELVRVPAAAAAGPGVRGRSPAASVEAVEAAARCRRARACGAAGAADEPFEPSAGRAASLLANVPAAIAFLRASLAQLRGDADGAAAFASQALAELGEDEWLLRSFVQLDTWPWPTGCAAGSRRPSARFVVRASPGGGRPASPSSTACGVCHDLGQVQRAQGRLDAALGTYRQALEIAAEPGQPPCPPLASRTWAWPRWPTSGTSSTPPSTTSPRASRCAGSLPSPAPLATGLAVAGVDPAGPR